MPRYTYECTAGHVYEKAEGFDAPVEQACRECEGPARRIPVAPAIVFKGTGFYKTDSRTKQHGSGSKSEDGKSSPEVKAPEKKPKAEPVASKSGSSGRAKSSAASTSKGKSKG